MYDVPSVCLDIDLLVFSIAFHTRDRIINEISKNSRKFNEQIHRGGMNWTIFLSDKVYATSCASNRGLAGNSFSLSLRISSLLAAAQPSSSKATSQRGPPLYLPLVSPSLHLQDFFRWFCGRRVGIFHGNGEVCRVSSEDRSASASEEFVLSWFARSLRLRVLDLDSQALHRIPRLLYCRLH